MSKRGITVPTSKSSTKAQSKPKKRQIKAAAPSVRAQATKSTKTPNKRSKKVRIRHYVALPFVYLFRLLKRVLRPFRFLLAPFKTRPMRAIGRFLASILLFRYFRDSWQELKQVQWPNARETVKLTIAVFAFAIFFSALISLVDYGLGKIFEQIIIK